MRLLFVLEDLHLGGAQHHTLALAEALQARWDVRVLALAHRSEELAAALPPEAVRALGRRGYDPRTWAALRREIAGFRPDVVASVNQVAATATAAALAGPGAPPVRRAAVFHSTSIRSLAGRLRTAAFYPAACSADALVFVSEAQRRGWRARGLRGRRDVAIANGVRLDAFTPTDAATRRRAKSALQLDPDGYVVGLLAMFRREKAIGDFVEALARLRAEGLAVEGLLVGDGPEREAISARLRRLRLQDHVRMAGLQRDVRPYLAAMDVGVLTSTSVETLPLAALETMATGAPMVMSDVGGAREIVEDGLSGYLFPPGDVDALADRLRALSRPGLRTLFGGAARRRVEAAFGHDRMVEAYHALFAGLAAPAKPPSGGRRATARAGA